MRIYGWISLLVIAGANVVALSRCSSRMGVVEADREPAAANFVAEQKAFRELEAKAKVLRPLPMRYGDWARERWKAKGCRGLSSDGLKCRLTECDYGVPNCRNDRIMLFRGDSTFRSRPAISGLIRTGTTMGSRYAPRARTSLELVEQVKADLKPLRPFDGYTDGESISLIRHMGRPEWRTYLGPESEDEADRVPDYKSPPMRPSARDKDIGFLAIMANLHFGGGMIHFFEAENDRSPESLDPYVSFSTHAEQAYAFAVPDAGSGREGQLLVASVPVSEIRTSCGEEIPEPGAILDLYPCEGIAQEHKGENEIDAFLYLKAEHILWTHKVPEEK